MFNELCSVYKDAHDAYGDYVDMETGECIKQMTIREFCLTDRWKPYVEHLRAMVAEHGAKKAKAMPEYKQTKEMLPGATPSGLFALYEDESLTHPGRRVMVSRRETHLQQHTGWLVIDIDLADNLSLVDFNNIRMVARFRPEIGLLMRSCSGTGYFGLVRLAYPEEHKAQFRALRKEYEALGIVLDKACSNIGRVRFASWDDPEHIYINEKCVAYRGLDKQGEAPMLVARAEQQVVRPVQYDDRNLPYDYQLRQARRLVDKIEAAHVDITGSYDDWLKIGISLYRIDPTEGYLLWKRVSRYRYADASNGHHEQDFQKRWHGFCGAANGSQITPNTFFWYCRQNRIELTREDYAELRR